jgi:transaldolase
MSDRLNQLSDQYGQSPWIDNLKRSFLGVGGGLEALVARGVKGVTSNPTIFQKAIAGSADYDEQFLALVGEGHSTEAAYWVMASDDVIAACGQMLRVYEETKGVDGYVSLEVSPTLAHDTPGTIEAARGLHLGIGVPNLMVKIPATAAGLPAIEEMIAEGRDINVTLIFSIERYAGVIEAYLTGLERFAASGATDLSGVASVASFFISRVDSEIEKRLDSLGTPEAVALKGKAAIAQAVLANHLFREKFSGPRWNRLTALGARVQRPLWASTSTKNPVYPDTLYVDSLIGPDTVNTLPDATLEAFADHGTLARTIDTVQAVAEASQAISALTALGIDLGDVAEVLEREGVASFAKSFEDLMATLESRRPSNTP